MGKLDGTLVTGGYGFVGVNLLKGLGKGAPVRIFDNLTRSSPTKWPGFEGELIEGDILDADALASGFRGRDKVVHLAAYGSVIESIADPDQNFSVNVHGTLNVLKVAVDAGVQRVVFASTGGALIGDATPPVSESSLPKPISPYGASKLCGEAYCHAFSKSYELETVCLRFGNVYGPHSVHKKGAVTTFIKALMRDEPIVIYGDGKASRDYVHVEDLCDGIMAALEVPVDAHDVFHIAAGHETSVLELAHMLRDVAGKPDHPIEFRERRRGEVTRNFADYQKARAIFGFEPKWRLEDGLAECWEWFSKQDASILATETTDS